MLFEIGAIKHRIRWGGDWDMDNDLSDNTFNDLVHFELYKPEA
jgi:peptidoglycan L-alanyl-D-glutamate endopeptidase CwlK